MNGMEEKLKAFQNYHSNRHCGNDLNQYSLFSQKFSLRLKRSTVNDLVTSSRDVVDCTRLNTRPLTLPFQGQHTIAENCKKRERLSLESMFGLHVMVLP